MINGEVADFFCKTDDFCKFFCLCFGIGENLRHCFAVCRLFKKLFDYY